MCLRTVCSIETLQMEYPGGKPSFLGMVKIWVGVPVGTGSIILRATSESNCAFTNSFQ